MNGTLNVVDIPSFYGLALTKVELGEFILKLYFGDNSRLDIEEYWEYVDKNLKSIDRYYSAQFRKEFLLPGLVSHKLVSSYKDSVHVELIFDNEERLLILVSGDISKADLLTRYVSKSTRFGFLAIPKND
jgi:hypothetical protein